jgi:hypothetical protein
MTCRKILGLFSVSKLHSGPVIKLNMPCSDASIDIQKYELPTNSRGDG